MQLDTQGLPERIERCCAEPKIGVVRWPRNEMPCATCGHFARGLTWNETMVAWNKAVEGHRRNAEEAREALDYITAHLRTTRKGASDEARYFTPSFPPVPPVPPEPAVVREGTVPKPPECPPPRSVREGASHGKEPPMKSERFNTLPPGTLPPGTLTMLKPKNVRKGWRDWEITYRFQFSPEGKPLPEPPRRPDFPPNRLVREPTRLGGCVPPLLVIAALTVALLMLLR